MVDRTRSRLPAPLLACLALGFGSVSGQEVDVVARPLVSPRTVGSEKGGAQQDVAVDYASIIRFSSSREDALISRENMASREGIPARPASLDGLTVSAPKPAVTAQVGSSLGPPAFAPAKNVATAASVSPLETPRSAPSIISEPEEEAAVVEEMRRRADRPVSSQGMRRSQHLESWEIPEVWSPGTAEVEWPEWVFSGADLYIEDAPAYADIDPLPLFYVRPPSETTLMRKVKKLVKSKAYREIRRHVKRRWRDLFRESPTMRFETYEETLAKINHIGKEEDRVDEFNEEYMANIARDHIFQREGRAGEADIPLFTWGPLTVTAEGDLRFDMGSAAASAGDEEVIVEKVQLGEKKAKPLFSGRDYKLNTSLTMSVNGDYTGGENYVPFLSTYGFEVEVEWLSDILGREMVAAELEVEFDDDGDVAGFLNFVIKSR